MKKKDLYFEMEQDVDESILPDDNDEFNADAYISPEDEEAEIDLAEFKNDEANKTDEDNNPDDTDTDTVFYDPLWLHRRLKQDPNPSKEKIKRIMENYRHGTPEERDQAQADMLGIMTSFCLWYIKKYYPTYIPKHLDDLLEYAYTGVLWQMQTYDEDTSMPTTWFVKGIKNQLQEYANIDKHSTNHFRSNAKKVFACINRKNELGIPYTLADIYKETLVPVKTIKGCLDIYNTTTQSIHAGEKPIDIPAVDFGDPQREAEKMQAKTMVEDLVLGKEDENGNRKSVLTPEEQLCIIMYYGLDDGTAKTLVQIEEMTGIKKYRAQKVINEAQKKLKEVLGKEKRNRLCKKIRNQVEIQSTMGGMLLSTDEMLSDQEAVAKYLESGLI